MGRNPDRSVSELTPLGGLCYEPMFISVNPRLFFRQRVCMLMSRPRTPALNADRYCQTGMWHRPFVLAIWGVLMVAPMSTGVAQDDEMWVRPASAANFYEPQNEPFFEDAPDNYQTLPQDVFRDEESEVLPEPFIKPEGHWVIPVAPRVQLSVTPGDGDDLGIVDIDKGLTLMSLRIPGLMVSPNLGVHFLDGPQQTDLPGQLYDVSFAINYRRTINERWSYMVGATPSFYTDGDNTSSDMFRMMGLALVFWECTDYLQLSFGAIYLDREDIAALPAVGLVYKPSEEARLELMFPRPRILRRIADDGERSHWIYLAGELGGGSWAIERSNGQDDIFTYGALRMLLGYEVQRASKQGFAPRVELGWVFNRSVEYKSGVGDYDPGSAALIRVGATF
jgi:hypothetical protein